LMSASRSHQALARRMKRTNLNFPVMVRRAPSRGELPVGIEADKPDYFLSLRRQAFTAVAEARKRVRNSIGRYSDPEVECAKDFLRRLGNECRSTGMPRGDRTQAHENQKMLNVFCQLSTGKGLQQIAVDMAGPKNYEKALRSLCVLTKRFSQRVHEGVRSEVGSVPEGLRQHGDRSWRYLSSFFELIKQWPGVISNCLEHGIALCEALRRYKPTDDEVQEFKRLRGHPVQVGPRPNI